MIARTLFWNNDSPPSVGDFLKVKDASAGELESGVPSGGGSLVRAQVTLQGFQTSEVPPSAPTNLTIQVNSFSVGTINVNFTPSGNLRFNQVFTIDYLDPGDGSVFIDLSTLSSQAQLASIINSTLSANNSGDFNSSVTDTVVTLTTTVTGSNTSLTGYTVLSSYIPISGGGSGTDDMPAAGDIQSATLIAAVSGKVIRPIRVWAVSGSMAQECFVKDDYDNGPVVVAGDTSSQLQAFEPSASYIDKWMTGCRGNLIAYFDSPVNAPGSCTFYIVAELVDA